MHSKARAAGVDPYAIERAAEQPVHHTVVDRGLRIEPPDWAREHAESVARERAEQARQEALRLEAAERRRQEQEGAA
jgi:hypothetical protein